ncbi:putative ribosome biogenesis protein RLP24 [Reticulomyxa filosa]|uniref:Putative ribosome biogenesis protein RLP24 n=1 Tax=Reticulomyxa filosa TaxID=46433 RepID=X6NWX6_RETFI|nr:putative ribosome biogenesis protein RLP24 [Reticulomyxa filosa]|eukprot:ETO30486.1 putative ribosome biogenesis protein RLP24 [Reticulomyxa filosa]
MIAKLNFVILLKLKKKRIEYSLNKIKVFRFCRGKCHNNFKMRRNPRRTRWTKAFRWSHGKELSNDNVLNFEKRRNIPTRYNRNLMAKTIQAIHRVNQIKALRDRRFYMNRFKDRQRIEKEQALRVIRGNLHMVIAPVAKELANSDCNKSGSKKKKKKFVYYYLFVFVDLNLKPHFSKCISTHLILRHF